MQPPKCKTDICKTDNDADAGAHIFLFLFLLLNLPASLLFAVKHTFTNKERQGNALVRVSNILGAISRMCDYCSHTTPSILSPQLQSTSTFGCSPALQDPSKTF